MARRPVTAGFTQELPIRGAGAFAAMGGPSVIDDCAHTRGARWNAARLGNVGRAGCLAGCLRTKTCKHLTSGKGAGLTLSNAEFMARAVILSGPDRRGGRPEAVPAINLAECCLIAGRISDAMPGQQPGAAA